MVLLLAKLLSLFQMSKFLFTLVRREWFVKDKHNSNLFTLSRL